jgi:alpha-L-rhamnosidase
MLDMQAMGGLRVWTLGWFALALFSPVAQGQSDGWITHAEAAKTTPIVLHFRREWNVDAPPKAFLINITADNRFIFFINGNRVASGPSTSSIGQWRYSELDIAPFLRRGRNVASAAVWNFGDVAPLAQSIVATGFRLGGEPISTGASGWRVKIDAGHTASKGSAQIPWQYYVASAPEIIDARKADWDWTEDTETGAGWQDAVAAPDMAARALVADPLPAQLYRPAAPGAVVRTSQPLGDRFPAHPVVVPANSKATFLIKRDAMISAYPQLQVSGGKGATLKLAYSEALYEAPNKKSDRELIGDRQVLGIFDTFIADGARRTFAPLWWRTWRFAELQVSTGTDPLTIEAFRVYETGYPFQQVASFKSSDPSLNAIWEIGWRTLRVDAHETFMDSSYWEQLQYTGDTRLEMLISYAVAGDPRLALQAIEAFAASNADGGLVWGAAPSRSANVIATFSLAWVGMLLDWHEQQPDPAPVVRHLPRMRMVLDWFEPFLNSEGLLGRNPQWNFIDWAGQPWDDRTKFPSWGKRGGSCLMTAMWLGALRQGAILEAAHGDAARAAADTSRADRARSAIREHCWDAKRGLFADNPDRDVFSQHMNTFAVLYDIATPGEAPAILERIVVAGKGIDAPPGMFTSTYYFAWYLVRAFEHAGLSHRYVDLLQTWRELLNLHYTTWPESRGDTRSDTHAWSAHPTADLLGIVAGIRPAAPGYARLRVAPVLGTLSSLDATAATPHGPVSVRYRIVNEVLTADLEVPSGLPGEFIWNGRAHPLRAGHNRLKLPVQMK